MALDYNGLVNRVVDIIHETNVTSTEAEQFIADSQPKIQRDILSTIYGGSVPRQMLARLDTTTNGSSKITLPSDYFETRDVTVGASVARYAPPEKVESNADGFSDTPVVLDYYQNIPELSSSNTTNWLIEVSQDVYIWGACVQYAPWSNEMQSNMARFNPFYEDAIRKTKSSHGAQPRGALLRQNGRQWGAFYTVIGSDMLFDRAK